MPLNYYAISRVLGGKSVPGKRARFGRLRLRQTLAEAERKRPREERDAPLTRKDDQLILNAFETVREGKAPDRLLWDAELLRRFHRECRAIGVHAPAKALTRRVITIRKSPERYARYGLVIPKSTVEEPQRSIVPEYAHVIEFSLVKLRYRYGASIDDILMDPDQADEFVRLGRSMAPQLTPEQLRLGALYIRKSRFLAKKDLPLFEQIDADAFETAFDLVGHFSTLNIDDVPPIEGVAEVREGDRYLYVSRLENLRATANQLLYGPALAVMSNGFWQPDPNRLSLHIFPQKSFNDVSIRRWQLKLIAQRKPALNWPVAA